MNPSMLKLSSVAEQSANPLMMGINDKLTYKPVFSPSNMNIYHSCTSDNYLELLTNKNGCNNNSKYRSRAFNCFNKTNSYIV